MGGKLGLGGRLVIAALVAGTLLFAAAGPGSADPLSYTVSIGNASPATSPEGDAPGANSMTFPVTIAGPSTTPDDINVTYTSSEGITPAFTIPAGTAPGTINLAVPINGDTSPADDRTMTVALTNVAFATDTTDSVALGGSTSGAGKIIDDDWRILSLSSTPGNATVSEAGGGTIDFQVTLAGPDGQPKPAPPNHAIKFDYTLTDGTGATGAKFGTNYKVTNDNNKQSDTLTIAPGASTADVKVQGINDGQYGYDKTFTITISNPVGASFAANATTSEQGTITESSAPPVIGYPTGCGSVTGGAVLSIPLRTSYASPIPATVTWTTTNVTATAGDLAATTGTATVPAGSRDGTISIQTNENPPQGNRTFTVTMSNPQQVTILGGGATVTCTINQPATAGEDKIPSLQLTDPSPVAQPLAGASPVTVPITVTLNPPVIQPSTPAPVNVHWQTQDGTATQPSVYTQASGDLHWNAGVFSSKTLNVQVNPATGTGNTPLKFTIAFTTTSAGFVGATVVNVTVVPPASPPTLSVSDASASESAGSVPAVVSLAPAATNAVTVQYATSDGSAKAGTDYTSISGTLTFAPGQTLKTVAVPVINNSQAGSNKSFTFTLSKPNGATISDATATLTIRNNDPAPAPPPPIVTGPSPKQPTPTPVPTKQPKGGKHVVLVQVLTGQSTIDAKGFLHFKLSCPVPAVTTCQGTVVLQVRVPGKKKKGSKKDPPPTTVTVGAGKFKIKVSKSASVKVKVTKKGEALVKTYRRIKVKATVTAKDGQNVKGVTAWFVTVQAPARAITVKTK